MKLSKDERRKQQKVFERKRDLKENFNYYIFIGFVILFVLIYWLKPLIIGYNVRHIIFIDVLPIVTGTAVLFIYRKRFINTDAVKVITKFHHKVGYTIAILICTSLIAYITLGSVANLLWECSNYYVAKTEKQQTIILPVNEFHKGSGSRPKHSIQFYFHGEKEYISVTSHYIRHCIAQSATKHRIELKIRKGVWDYYSVEDWDIVK